MTEAGTLPSTEALWARLRTLEAEVSQLSRRVPEERVSLLVVNGDFERVHTALMLAHAAVALELEVSLYFAMWGVQALRAKGPGRSRTVYARCLNAILASNVSGLPSSRMNFGGLGPLALVRLMQKHAIASPAQLLDLATEAGVALVACPLSLSLFELTPADLLPDVEVRGAASFLEEATRSRFSAVF